MTGKRDRKHGRRGRWRRRLPVLIVLVSVVVLGLVGAAYAGYRYDRAHATRLLPGVKIAGVNVGGMTRQQALEALEPVASRILDREIRVRVGKKVSVLRAEELGTRVRVERAVDRAFALAHSYGIPERLYHLLLDKPVGRRIKLKVTRSSASVESFIDRVAAEVDREPVDAAIDFEDGRLVRRGSKMGQALDTEAGKDALMLAVRGKTDAATLPVVAVAPRITADELGDFIVVRLSQNRLYHYEGLSLTKRYDVATGTAEYPTPKGDFEIINKRENPTWVNPDPEGWGASLPESIPPGPGNPLGTRALDIDAPGIRIHGTYDPLSIGSYASHGCIRMLIPESEELFQRVDVGTRVVIAA